MATLITSHRKFQATTSPFNNVNGERFLFEIGIRPFTSQIGDGVVGWVVCEIVAFLVFASKMWTVTYLRNRDLTSCTAQWLGFSRRCVLGCDQIDSGADVNLPWASF